MRPYGSNIQLICIIGLFSCSFGLIQKNQKIKATTAKATNSHREAKISETRFAQTPRFLNASLGICLTLSPLMPFLLLYISWNEGKDRPLAGER